MGSMRLQGNYYISSFCRSGKSICFKDTHMEKAPSNKTPAFTKSMNIDIWVVVTSNQLFIRGSYTEQNFQINKVVIGKTPFFGF